MAPCVIQGGKGTYPFLNINHFCLLVCLIFMGSRQNSSAGEWNHLRRFANGPYLNVANLFTLLVTPSG